VDINQAEFILFNKGSLIPPVLWSMAVSGMFDPVRFQNTLLMDGWLMNNFPVDRAKKKYPKTEIIGIALNKFQDHHKITSVFSSFGVGFDILMRNQILPKFHLVDHLFCRKLCAQRRDNKEVHLKKIFHEGYKDCLKYFWK
jgi:NTE family protein